MKKLMALLLALSVALGMVTVAFAETKYYLANRPLDIEEEGVSADPPTDENANANPGTGC